MTVLEQNKPIAQSNQAPAAIDFVAFMEVTQLHQRYAQLLDSGDFSGWPDLFTDVCTYKIQSRENFDAGLPLCTLSFESQGMLRDRVYGAAHTIFHDPYYQRHIVSAPNISRVDGDVIEAETAYLVLRTRRDNMPEILSTGRYIDRMQRTAAGLQFSQRICVFDNDLIANSLIYPI
jgi:salicylate 5-hydroxylase small subunit